MSGFHLGGGGGGICPPLEFVCQYAYYDNPVCRPLKVTSLPPLDEFSKRNPACIV